MPVPFELDTLRIIWWLLVGVLLAGFAIMDGFDFGVGILLPWVGRSDNQRRVLINTIGPVWEGNQVWFITGGGALFAAWPLLYSVSFSGFYFAMFLVLLALILRPVAIKFRSKRESTSWRTLWDSCIFASGLVPALIFGVAIGNVLQGVPFYFDPEIRAFYTGSFWALLNPFGIFCGVGSIAMLTQQGAVYLASKTEGVLLQRAVTAARWAGLCFVGLFVGGFFWLQRGISGYQLTATIAANQPSNPLHKTVSTGINWLHNFNQDPRLWALPLVAIVAIFGVLIFAGRGRGKIAWLFSSLSIATVIATIGTTLYPFLLPSSSQPNMSLTIWDASSSQMTLFIMTIAAVIFVPIILLYTAWVYRVLRGVITERDVENRDKSTEMY
jgi:cytochrome d ubiquinol oxidase subunit II